MSTVNSVVRDLESMKHTLGDYYNTLLHVASQINSFSYHHDEEIDTKIAEHFKNSIDGLRTAGTNLYDALEALKKTAAYKNERDESYI